MPDLTHIEAVLAGEVAVRLGRRFLGIELNTNYVGDIALARIERGEGTLTRSDQKAGQGTLFGGKE